jgi:hypothetical protein
LFIHNLGEEEEDDDDEDEDDNKHDPQNLRVVIWTDEIEPVTETFKHQYVTHVLVIGTVLNPLRYNNNNIHDPNNETVCLRPEEENPLYGAVPQINDSRVQFQQVTTSNDVESCEDLLGPSNHVTAPFDVILVDG